MVIAMIAFFFLITIRFLIESKLFKSIFEFNTYKKVGRIINVLAIFFGIIFFIGFIIYRFN